MKLFALVLSFLLSSTACAEPFQYGPLNQPRGASFTFNHAVLGSDMDGTRYLTVDTTQAQWQSFLDVIKPQHDDFAVYGYVPILAADDWSVDLTNGTATLVAPIDVYSVPYYSPTLARMVPSFVVETPHVPNVPPMPPVPEPSTWALLLAGFVAVCKVAGRNRKSMVE